MELVDPATIALPIKSPEAVILVPDIAPLLVIVLAVNVPSDVKLPWLSKEPIFLRLASLKVIPSFEL